MTNPLPSDQRRAFPSAPDPRRYYAASAIEEARLRIVRAIARYEGPALVVGAVGNGKSTLLAVLAEQYEPRMSVVRLPGAQLCTRRALLQMILCELRLPYRHMDEGELRLSILEHLRGPSASNPMLREPSPPGRGQGEGASQSTSPAPASPPRRMLVLVDEADSLPTRLLEELRVLTNVVVRGVPLVSLVLAGSPVLEERFADPEFEKFSQRLSCRCYLAPFTREETSQYVRSQVSAVGVKPEKWFDPDALAAVHAATGGVPRLVNQLGDQLVWMIEETGCQPLDAALVQQAWSDLQQLPAPWNTDAHSSLASSPTASVGQFGSETIEFGELDDELEEEDELPLASRGVSAPGGFSVPAPGAFGGSPPDANDLGSTFGLAIGDDLEAELFVGHDYSSPPESRDVDDDLPASIPIDAARRNRNADFSVYAASLAATEQLVDQLDEFETLALVGSDPEPQPVAAPVEPPPASAVENPFAEPFAEEELLVDPYSGFENQTLRTARQVTNRIDRTFAADLARCEPRVNEPAIASPASVIKPAMVSPIPSAPSKAGAPLAPRSSLLAPPPTDLIIIEDDDASAAAVVPGRQFRRLFSSLEAGHGPRALHG